MAASRVIQYYSNNLIIPVVNDLLSSELAGSTCVMTFSNDEALHIAGLLHEKGIKSKLIQSNDDFDLSNMVEIRFLMSYLKDKEAPTITGEKWESALKALNLEIWKKFKS